MTSSKNKKSHPFWPVAHFFTNEIGAQNSDAGQVIPTSCLGTSREGSGEGGGKNEVTKKKKNITMKSHPPPYLMRRV